MSLIVVNNDKQLIENTLSVLTQTVKVFSIMVYCRVFSADLILSYFVKEKARG